VETVRIATTMSGKKLPYVVTDNPPRGGMKYTYFAPDRSYVIQFYNNPAEVDYNTRSRITAIIGKYNPTVPESRGGAIGTDEDLAAYFAKRFCWPEDIVVTPQFGLVSPAYPSNFFFGSAASDVLNLYGRDKKSNWFTSNNRKFLHKNELGDFRSALQCSILLARSVRRLHQAGLAHSDLSNNNVLIDPTTGDCIVIDIDSLVVPGLYPPEVAGTRGYIAPEVVATMELDRRDPHRVYPSAKTDLHALAVLIYEYIFFRHPLIGPKINSSHSAEEDDRLSLGERALFVEHPADVSNAHKSYSGRIGDLGSILEKLFLRAFAEGLHDPRLRPSAMEWERGLVRAWELLTQCENPDCERKWFILDTDEKAPVCPFCGARTKGAAIRFSFYNEVRTNPGEYRRIFDANITDNTPLFIWHFTPNVYPDEKTDRTLMAYVIHHAGEWYLVNSRVHGLTSPDGRIIPPGRACRLFDGALLHADGGIIIKVKVPQA
jgi:serine/threonine protein kinase